MMITGTCGGVLATLAALLAGWCCGAGPGGLQLCYVTGGIAGLGLTLGVALRARRAPGP